MKRVSADGKSFSFSMSFINIKKSSMLESQAGECGNTGTSSLKNQTVSKKAFSLDYSLESKGRSSHILRSNEGVYFIYLLPPIISNCWEFDDHLINPCLEE
ncbi:uncharacterized protein [Euphorbia lathyris]|uniref:uncharacterized protein n=1 Tax=Euphorbia lathyris TaxID=212925 RepID=UPI0033138C5A